MFLVLLFACGASAACTCSEDGFVCTGSVSALDVKTGCPKAKSATFITDDKALCTLCDERKVYARMTVKVSTELCSCLQQCCDMISDGCPCTPSTTTTTTGPTTPAAAPASLSVGAIIGICVGVVAIIALIAIAAVLAVMKKRQPQIHLPPLPDMIYNPLDESL
jgi:hypothetical protein